ncbi:MAG: YciI family protein, partial [Bauldia sp.]
MKFMTMVKSTENNRLGPPPQALMDGIMQLGEEAAKAGVFVEMGGLKPSAAGATLRLSGGEITVK